MLAVQLLLVAMPPQPEPPSALFEVAFASDGHAGLTNRHLPDN
ncbi:MAG: hypothetical protein QOE34_2575 [Verrucomicrobiota bacterium]|jgi:hypothetical protein